MYISFILDDAPNSILLISATSADGVVTDYNSKAIMTNTYQKFEAGGKGPWQIRLSGYYVGPDITINSPNDLIAAYSDTAKVCVLSQ